MIGEHADAARGESAATHPLGQGSGRAPTSVHGGDGVASASSVSAAERAVPGKAKRPMPIQTGDNGDCGKPATASGARVQGWDNVLGADDGECERVGEDHQRPGGGKPAKKKRRRGRNRKRQPARPGEVSGSAPSVPEAPTEYLLQYTCRLLESQALDYEVRGREIEEKNSAQALEIEAWEKKVRALKRRLHDLQYDEAATTRASLATAERSTKSKGQANGVSHEDAAPSVASIDATDSLIPVNVAQIEDKVQQLIRERTQKLTDFAQSLPGDFKETLEQQIARLVDVDRGIRQ